MFGQNNTYILPCLSQINHRIRHCFGTESSLLQWPSLSIIIYQRLPRFYRILFKHCNFKDCRRMLNLNRISSKRNSKNEDLCERILIELDREEFEKYEYVMRGQSKQKINISHSIPVIWLISDHYTHTQYPGRYRCSLYSF